MSEAQRCANVMRRYGMMHQHGTIKRGCFDATVKEIERQELRIAELSQQLEDAKKDVERKEHTLEQLRQWSLAYPLSVFPEPDLKKAHEVLTANGMTLDAISAYNMRHVITKVIEIVDSAIAASKPAGGE